MADGRCIPANKAILAGSIPYFFAMFTHNMAESHQSKIVIKETDPDALELLIGYAYTGQICITPKNVQSLLVTSSFLQITEVLDICSDYIEERLRLSNAIAIRRLADTLACSKLVDAANCLLLNVKEYFQSKKFLNSQFNEIVEDLESCHELQVTDEKQVFTSIIAWVKHESSRTRQLPELLILVRIPLLNFQFIDEYVCSEDLIRASPECKDLVNNYLKNHHYNTFIYILDVHERRFLVYYPITGKCEIMRQISREDNDCTTAAMYHKLCVFNYYTVVALYDKLCVCGPDCLFIFDQILGTWSEAAPLKPKRGCAGVAALHNKLYVCGGMDKLKIHDTVEYYDAERNVWTKVASMSEIRYHVGIVACKNYIYAVGGRGDYKTLNTVERYDPRLNRWTTVPPMLCKRARHAVATMNGLIYVCGGRVGQDIVSSAEVYDPETMTWKCIASMNAKRSHFSLVACDHKLYAIGGIDKNCKSHKFSSIETYDPKYNTWEFVESSRIPIKYDVPACVVILPIIS